MSLRPQIMFAVAFATLAMAYAAWFNIIVRVDVDAAQSRFDVLLDSRSPGRAAPYGERVLKMKREAGTDEEALAPLKADLAKAQIARRNFSRGASLAEQALSSKWAEGLTARERVEMEDGLARAHIFAGELDKAAAIYSAFLDLAGDEAARSESEEVESLEAYYASRIEAAGDLFAESLKPTGGGDLFQGSREARLAAASQLASLGAFYAMRSDGLYAAAGVLSAAFDIRKEILGADNQGTVQIALILGPVYAEMGRLNDAEKLYLDAFHAQEKVKGSNSPDLSLYIKLLAGIYERQGRATEAQALYEHMRSLFRDAFGAQRYSANRARDRRLDIDRPVSQYFVLPANYAPVDLVSAADFSVPLSKNADLDEMKLRRAADEGADPREANLPARLAQLISLCRGESGERVTLRSGYRAYTTQKDLYSRIGYKGTVTPPGMSEHQLGLAADIDVDGRLMRKSDATYQCFEENAFRFGFILSYPPGNDYLPGVDSYEPWHWRYVGISTAQLYREAGPDNKPQEFLASLPCYRERAASGGFATAGEADICLAEPAIVAASAKAATGSQLASENAKAARKLNNRVQGAGSP
ncbi:MAG: D-alanyl-D-alanine carboxypeptidase family protein [Pseudomonadota bacterium]|nr:D-alanyl-D-alanine carboxypeptidase family protein [Pseudomonadota bacterium]